MPAAGGDGIGGGICVKTDADKCLGGELTVTGTCLCNSQVVMSGETYDLEFVQGKCLPKRCPVQTMLKEGKCVAISAGAPERIEPQHGKPSVPGEASEEEVRRHPCGHGMIRTRSGCMHAHRRYPGPVGSRIYQRLGY